MTEQLMEQRSSLIKRCIFWFKHHFAGCEKALCHAAAAVTGYVIGVELASLYFPDVLGYVITCTTAFAALETVFFLLQEINREINTTGSKCNNLDIARNVIDVKAEIEKLREQVQNIE